MYAVKLDKLFTSDFDYTDTYPEDQFTYNGSVYLPLDVLRESDYIVRLCNIEVIDYE